MTGMAEWSRRESSPRPPECHPIGTPSHQTLPAHKWREHRAVRIGALTSCGLISAPAEKAQSPYHRKLWIVEPLTPPPYSPACASTARRTRQHGGGIHSLMNRAGLPYSIRGR
jgi:hypothetical protein